MGAKYFGAAVPRREDPRFLRGEGRFVDDVTLPGFLHAAFLRSPHAHARIVRIETAAARAMPGVAGVFAFDDLARFMKPLPLFGAVPPGLGAAIRSTCATAGQMPLCRGLARYVGEIVAMVVADSPERAGDAVERIEVEWELLPVVVDMVAAARPGGPLVHPEWGTNVAVGFRHGIGDADGSSRERAARVHRDLPGPALRRACRWRPAASSRSGTGATARSRPGTARRSRTSCSRASPGPSTCRPHSIRVIAPDLGGGFGTKASGYAEDLLVPVAAIALGRPVKWIERPARAHDGRGARAPSDHAISLAARRDGTILAVRDHIWLDLGAYNVWGVVLPYNTVAHLLGPASRARSAVEVEAVVTHKTPNAPYRGAGRPETVFAMDRAVDGLARELGIDPAEIRRRNYLTAADLPWDLGMPYRDGNPLVYDTGDFRAALDTALDAAGYAAFRAEQAALRARGIWRGIGISGYVEGTAIGPFEGARVTLDLSGRVLVADRRGELGPGPRDVVRPDRRRRARRAARLGHGDRRGHRGRPVRRRHLRQPQRRDGRQLDLRRGRTRCGPRWSTRRPRCWRPPKKTSRSRTARSRCAARRHRRCRWPASSRPRSRPSPSPAWRRRTSTRPPITMCRP